MATHYRKINRHVTYVKANAKRRPATITAVGAGTAVDLRVGRAGETYAGVSRRTAHGQTNVYEFV
jgi:hypothetical protein